MAFFEFPHTRTYNSDLGWLIKAYVKVEEKLDQYLENSVITFADPITWDITSQYTALTCVIDSDGTAYLSKQPVPVGISIHNTDYWMPIFNYNDSINKLRSSIATNATDTGTTPVSLQTNDLVWYAGELYAVDVDLPAGSAIIPGTNATKITLEAWIDAFKTYVENAFTTVNNDIGQLQTDLTALTNTVSTEFTKVSKSYNSVAEMVADTDLKANDHVYLFGYYYANDGGPAFYKIYDSEPAQPYILLANGCYAKIQAAGFITPKMFGAKGDGTSDDHDAIVEAITYAQDTDLRLIFTDVEKGYYISQGVEITRPLAIQMDGAIWYHDTGAALTLNEADYVHGTIRVINGYNGSEYFDAPNGSIGLLLYNADANNLEVLEIAGFDNGMRLESNDSGCCYNSIQLGTIRRCKTGIKLLANGTGWTNENKFFAGDIWVASIDSFKATAVGIDIEGNANNRCDANIFYSPCCEGLYCGVKAKYAVCNYVYDMRTEATSYAFRGAEDAYLNEIYVSFGNTTASTQLSGNLVTGHLDIPSKITRYKVFDSGELTNRTVFANASQTYFGSSKVCFLNTASAAFSPTKNLTDVSFNGTGISIDSTRIIGVRLDARSAKRFRIKQFDQFNNAFARPVVAAIDTNGNYLPTGVLQVEPAPLWSLQTIGSAQVFTLGSNTADVYVAVSGLCTDVFIGFMPGSTGHTLREFQIWADEPSEALDSVTPGLDSIPTKTSYSGCICPCSSYVAADTFYGWRSLGGGSYVQI